PDWAELRQVASALAAEALAAEKILLRSPDLLKKLGLPKAVLSALTANPHGLTPSAARVMRFDFHWTTGGWRISEVNSDVPGGFTEATEFTASVSRHLPGTR